MSTRARPDRRRRAVPLVAGLIGAAVMMVGASAPSPAGASGPVPAVTTALEGPSWLPVINQDFPDPDVLDYQGTLFAYSTQVAALNVPGATSDDAVQWADDTTPVFPQLPSWASWGATWSPSVAQNAAGQFVMYYTAADAQLETHCIGRAVATEPEGPFVDSSSSPIFCQADLGGDIDPDIFTAPGGQSYLIWKSDGNSIGMPPGLWAQPLDASLTPTGTPTELMGADEAWQGGVVEGPDMVFLDGTYYLFYSGNTYSSSAYAVGYATCATPLGPCTDSPDNPILTSAPGMSGPGGVSLFTAPSGQLLMAFAAWPGAVGYGAGGYRAMYMARVGLSDGVPVFSPDSPGPATDAYREVGADGGVFAFGGASYRGSTGSITLEAPVVDSAPTPDAGGYWLASADGGVFAYGDARYYGSLVGAGIHSPVVGITPTADGRGYWLVTAAGGVYSFGDAVYQGSMAGRPLGAPAVGLVPDRATGGYWIVAADGGVFAFDAPYFGSMGGSPLSAPVVGAAATGDDGGYWMVGADGGVFAFGDAPYLGSMGGHPLNAPMVALLPTPDGRGYWMAAADGGVFAFGDAPFEGSMGGRPLNAPMVAIAPA